MTKGDIRVGCSGWLAAGCDVYAYFNNDYEGNAVLDAQWLVKVLRG